MTSYRYVLTIFSAAYLVGCASTPPTCQESRGLNLSNQSPKYPIESRKNREEGRTELRVKVNNLGYPQKVNLEKSSGHKKLDDSAISAVESWCFVPTNNSKNEYVIVPIQFSLTKNSDRQLESNSDNLVADIVREKILKNGPSLLCDQEEYLACYGITNKKCLTEIAPKHIACIEKTDSRYGKISEENTKLYGGYYGSCIAMEHVLTHSKDAKKISDCIGNINFDQDKGIASLLK